VPSEPSALAGHWQGSLWESHAPPIYKQGSAAIDLTIAPEGTGIGMIGPDRASGNDTRRWSETHAFFGDRESPASASLRKVL
jgi:hypothetical protein